MTMIEPPPINPLHGEEPFVGLEGTVSDFWRFALPDVQTNNTRGWFAEYLVWRALGIEKPLRIEWDAFDVLWKGIRVEVKSSAFVQRWAQRRPSDLTFSGFRSKLFDPITKTYADEETYNAQVYVFAANLAESHAAYDQLDVGLWRFAVIPRSRIVATGQKSMVWARAIVESGGDVGFDELGAAIERAGEAELG
ncbi:hypothetical protein [Microbacterium sp. A84]|uniref:hypothetical protein n=1 Tax=Microbacterium sp. A84 TaxID=3450715 RepID=UPI003F41E382